MEKIPKNELYWRQRNVDNQKKLVKKPRGKAGKNSMTDTNLITRSSDQKF